MQETKKIFRFPLPTVLPLRTLLSIFPRPATAASTRQGTPPPRVTVVRLAAQDTTPAAENIKHMKAIQAAGSPWQKPRNQLRSSSIFERTKTSELPEQSLRPYPGSIEAYAFH